MSGEGAMNATDRKGDYRNAMTAFLLIAFSLCSACSDLGSDVKQNPPRLSLALVDVGVLEAYLHVKVQVPAPTEQITIKRNGNVIFALQPPPQDTVLVDTALAPGTVYSYRGSLRSSNGAGFEEAVLDVRTLLPTSHELTWERTLLGDGNYSRLLDAAIVNDTLAYAVGEVYLRDSVGNIQTEAYNLARWNGKDWHLERLQFWDFPGQPSTHAHPASAIAVTSPGEAWISSGSQITKWNGQFQTSRTWLTVSVNSIWASSSLSIYAVGVGGRIAHFNGSTWGQIQSGTSTSMTDVWGIVDEATRKEEVFCTVTDFWEPKDKKLLRITPPEQVDSVSWTPGRNLFSVWTAKGMPLIAGGDGLFENSRGFWRKIPLEPDVSTTRVRGTGLNDMFVVGSFGFLAHWNGIDYHRYGNLIDGTYTCVAVTRRLVMVTGANGDGSAVVLIGRRN